jgi:hypothetical protein
VTISISALVCCCSSPLRVLKVVRLSPPFRVRKVVRLSYASEDRKASVVVDLPDDQAVGSLDR